jgi:hypothetical protein
MVSLAFGDAKAESGIRSENAIFAALFSIADLSPCRKLDASS